MKRIVSLSLVCLFALVVLALAGSGTSTAKVTPLATPSVFQSPLPVPSDPYYMEVPPVVTPRRGRAATAGAAAPHRSY